MIFSQVAVRIPFAVAVHLNETHAAFDEAAGEQTFRADIARDILIHAVHRQSVFGFVPKICEIERFQLHSIRKFEAVDACKQIRFAIVGFKVLAVNVFEEIELSALIVARDVFRAGEIQDGRAGRTKERALIAGWQKPGAPIQRTALNALIIAEDNVAGKILALAAKAIRDPRTRAGKSGARVSNSFIPK